MQSIDPLLRAPLPPAGTARGTGASQRAAAVRPERAPAPPILGQAEVIQSGRDGIRHPVVYELDAARREIRVPDLEQSVAFLISVTG